VTVKVHFERNGHWETVGGKSINELTNRQCWTPCFPQLYENAQKGHYFTKNNGLEHLRSGAGERTRRNEILPVQGSVMVLIGTHPDTLIGGVRSSTSGVFFSWEGSV
jgi:hypothetical protein